jgi:type I restriction enzyme M protein
MAQQTKDGYIIDFISGQEAKATPEEVDAVQVFAKQLVEDYEYPKNHIQTRPQYRVKQRPSGGKYFPVDISVFTSENHSFDNEYIIVECKKKNRKDGKKQLEDYLHFSKAYLGVWFNGEERLFLRKTEKQGKILFEEIPNIPRYGQRIEDIGKFKRKDLRPTHNLKATFKAIRNHLAANTIGATRDEVLAQQLINLIFCKIYDERFTEPDEIVTFRAGIDEEAREVKERILELFEKVKRKYKEVLDESDTITLDVNSIVYVVGELQNYCLIEAERDIIADAFETFIGHALKGGQGQFFTPRNVIKMMVNILDPDDEDSIIDPACGSGGFLIEALRHVWRKLDVEGEKYHWNKNNLQEEKMEVALNKIKGMDKDYFLAKVSKAYMAIIGDGKSGIVCEDSLENPQNWSDATRQKVHLENYSVLLTNPPFGAKIPVSGEDKLKQFELGHKWKQNKITGKWEKGRLKEKEAPQILFIERCLQLLEYGGRMAIVLPDGIYGNNQLGYIRRWLLERTRIVAIIDLPVETFMPNTPTKTTIIILQKLPKNKIPNDYPVFMAIAETCGHDRRGKPKDEDNISEVSDMFREWATKNNFSFLKV